MVPAGLDIIINVFVYVLTALLVVNATLDDMEEVRDDTARGKTLALVIEIKAPWI